MKPVVASFQLNHVVFCATRFTLLGKIITCGRDVGKYGSVVVHEAFLRFIAAVLLIPAALLYGYGWLALVGGITDALWGIAYLTIVPRQTGRSLADLVFDRRVAG